MNVMRTLPIAAIMLALLPLSMSGCQTRADGEQPRHEHAEQETHEHPEHVIVVTSPKVKDVVLTQPYVCQIHARRYIELRALVGGYLKEVHIREGQKVKEGDLLFKILPVLYEARWKAELAKANVARIQLAQSKKLQDQNFVSDVNVAIHAAELASAEAEANLAEAELGFTNITAPYDGIVDHLYEFQGSLIEEGDILTTLSDNSVMWVYFNVPEARYLEYMAGRNKDQDTDQTTVGSPVAGTDVGVVPDDDDADDDADDADDDDAGDHADDDADDDAGDAVQHLGRVSERIDLVLADGSTFPHPGEIGAIEAKFNNETGNIHFRADFPNPKGLLRHGQTGTVLLHRTLHNAIVIPQRAMFEILDKQYVFVVDDDNVVHIREIIVQDNLEDLFVVKKRDDKTGPGLDGDEKIIFEGIRQVRDGDKVDYEFRAPEDIFENLKYHAE